MQKTVKKTRRPRMSKVDRKEQILNMACDCFSRFGYDAVTTKQLSEALGCSEALIFQCFPTKDSIYMELMREWEAGMNLPVELERVDDSPLKTLEKMYTDIILTRQWNKNRNTRPHLEAAVLSRLGMSAEHYRILGESQDVVYQTILPFVREGQDIGEIRQGDPMEIALLFWTIIAGTLELRKGFPGRYPKIPFQTVQSSVF